MTAMVKILLIAYLAINHETHSFERRKQLETANFCTLHMQSIIKRMHSNDHLPSVGLNLFCAARLSFFEDHGVYC